MRFRVFWLVTSVSVFPAASVAQEAARPATLSGVVTDSLQQPIADVEVAIPGLQLSVRTNEWGGFRIPGVTPGAHTVTVRRVGYGPLELTLEFAASATVQRRVVLFPSHLLEEVVVRAATRDPALESFEENRRLGLGVFLTREDLERQEGRRLGDVMRNARGAAVVSGTANRMWLAASRGARSLGRDVTLDTADVLSGARRGVCYAQVYLDNARVYRGEPREPLFDLGSISVDQIEAIEYFASPAQLPARYSALNATCGVLVIHTRRNVGGGR